uniref:EGF-like domain-containing protein n=1 Tax=Peronospora matthiolae TaxID=2874970 RepID=A0AAV1VLY4_9STRA
MRGHSRVLLGLLTALASLLHSRSSLAAGAPVDGVIIVRGHKLYNAKTGERFFIKGLTYEYAVSDEYYDKYSKATIEENLAGLKYNTLRLYNINPEASYVKFMADMANLGVYVMVSASPDNDVYYGKYRYSTITKKLSCTGKVSAGDGAKTVDQTETCYPALLLEYGKKIIKNFAQYDNTLGVVVANEIMQMDLTSASCVKAYVADLKTWMTVNGKRLRILPLAYAAADSSTDKVSNADDYHVIKVQGLLCGDEMRNGMMAKSIDIYLINEYRWCPDSTFDEAYKRYIDMAQGIPVVVAFGEYGCKTSASTPRTWGMVPYMYEEPSKTKQFSAVWSGGLAYSYGEAKLGKDSLFPMFTGGSTDFLSTPSSKPLVDYTNLKAQFAKYSGYKDDAEWTDGTTCSWTPTLETKTQPSNKIASQYGWIVSSCTASNLKLSSTDSWICSSREGVVCGDDGSTCDVALSSSLGTTQEDICGTYEVVSGGGTCETTTDCGGNGQCKESNGTKSCSCLSCYTGTDCSVRDITSCATLSSSTSAPHMIFVGVGVFLGVMLVVFIALGVAAAKKKAETNKLAEQVRADGSSQATADTL